jgi:hypothetical protein
MLKALRELERRCAWGGQVEDGRCDGGAEAADGRVPAEIISLIVSSGERPLKMREPA